MRKSWLIMAQIVALATTIGIVNAKEISPVQTAGGKTSIPAPAKSTMCQSLMRNAAGLWANNRRAEARAVMEKAFAVADKAADVTPEWIDTVEALGSLYEDGLQDHKAAEGLYRKAIEKLEHSAKVDKSVVFHYRNKTAATLVNQNRIAEAKELYLQNLAAMEKVKDTQPALIFMCLQGLENLYFNGKEYAKAEDCVERMIPLVSKSADKDSEVFVMASARASLADIYRAENKIAKAEEQAKKAIALLESGKGSTSPLLARYLISLGDMYYHAGKYAQAEPQLKKAQKIFDGAEWHDQKLQAIGLGKLSLVLDKTGRQKEAKAMEARAWQMYKAATAPAQQPAPQVAVQKDPALDAVRQSIKNVLDQKEQASIAPTPVARANEADCRTQIAKLLMQPNVYDLQLAKSLSTFGQLSADQGKMSTAAASYELSLKLFERLLGKNDRQLLAPLQGYANALRKTGREALARQFEERANLLNPSQGGKAALMIAGSFSASGNAVRDALNITDDASTKVDESVRKLQLQHEGQLNAALSKSGGRPALDVASSACALAGVYLKEGRVKKSEALYKESLKMYERLLGDSDPHVAEVLDGYAQLLKQTNRASEADSFKSRAAVIRRRAVPTVGQSTVLPKRS